MSAHYEEAVRYAMQTLDEAESAGVTFAIPHAMVPLIGAQIGLRQFKRAELLLEQLSDRLRQVDDSFERFNWRALKARLFLARRNPSLAARELDLEWERIPTRSLRAECQALRALALAADGDPDLAIELSSSALSGSREVQAVCLARLTVAILDLKGGENNSDALAAAENAVTTSENFDSLVCAYRTYPPLLRALRNRSGIASERLTGVIRQARDFKIAASIGWTVPKLQQIRPTLSRREREVYALLCRGLTNREIAKILFISEVTVKVHVRHILEKLGARSRTEAVLKLQDD
jgi:ATP/maltotriose-dependent transcriptional regulator MalT